MAQTKQDKAVAAANSLIALMSTMRQLVRDGKEFLDKYNQEAYNTTWAAFSTAAQNADGTLGTADGTPVAGHPINTGFNNSLGNLAKSVTATQLTNGVVALQQFDNFARNVAVVTGNYLQNMADLDS